jgi:hypothetical protein
MNTFNKKSLCAALAAVGTLGVAGTANAVYVNPDGLGQVLIYPYYTVRNKVAGADFNSLLSVVNSTASAKAVKVRFVEGRNSAEVLRLQPIPLGPRRLGCRHHTDGRRCRRVHAGQILYRTIANLGRSCQSDGLRQFRV